MKKIHSLTFYFFLLIFFQTSVYALDHDSTAPSKPLPISQAFIFSTKLIDNHRVDLNWKIAPGHYLYRDKFDFSLMPANRASLGKIVLPAGKKQHDDILGNYEVYKDELQIALPIENIKPSTNSLRLNATYQGCTAWGYCYPPVNKIIQLDLNGQRASFDSVESISEQDEATQLLKNENYFKILLGFLSFGLLLAFTPCVLPMIPILSGIIANQQKNVIKRKAFLLSLTYVLSMSFTYAGIGVLVSLMGNNVQTALQTPWAFILGSLLFFLLALSLFGFYELKLPHRLHHTVHLLSSRQKGGGFFSVAIMGFLATLLVSPCVTPPLVGALAYIAASGNLFLGASALFLMGFGMGIPLLVLGVLGSKFLPKAGPWMETIRHALGVLMLIIALQLLSRALPGTLNLALWGCFLLGCAVFVNGNKLRKVIALILVVEGILMLIGASMGNSDPFQPLAHVSFVGQQLLSDSSGVKEKFRSVQSLQEVLTAVKVAKMERKPVLLDFYADWCVSCKKMDKKLFENPVFESLLSQFKLLRVDMTKQNKESELLKNYFHVVAPPTLIFFDANGQVIQGATLVGEVKPQKFEVHLEKILAS